MSRSTQKKVQVSRFGYQPIEGFIWPDEFLKADGIVLMGRSAEQMFVPYEQLRAVYYIREFGEDPQRDQLKAFHSRPKRSGLWVRMRLLDGDEIEGVIPNEIGIMGQPGVTLTPPGTRGGTQRVFVPNRALETFSVLGVIGKPDPSTRRRRKAEPDEAQMELDLFPKDPQRD